MDQLGLNMPWNETAFSLQCYRQLLEQIGGLLCFTDYVGCPSPDLLYQFNGLLKAGEECPGVM